MATENGVDWKPLDDALARLLSVRVDERQGVSGSSASAPWLVAHLHVVKGGGDAKIQGVLEAIAALVSAIEGCGRSPLTKTAMWTRVLTSCMMALPLRVDDATVWRFTRQHERSGSVRVLLDWTGVKIEKVLASLGKFLGTERIAGTLKMAVGLRLARCRVSAESIAALDGLLVDLTAAGSSRLVSGKLVQLDLSDNGLPPEALEAVATLLRHHEVEELRLENAFYRAADARSVAANRSLLESAFSRGDTGSPIELSLASNSLDARYYEVISSALQSATRPIRRLSLARTMVSTINNHDREDCWGHLASILFSRSLLPGLSVPQDCELDLSGNALFDRDHASFQRGLAVFLSDIQGLIHYARANNQQVWCRVAPAAQALNAPDRRAHMTVPLSPSRIFGVEDVTDDGWVLLLLPPEATTTKTHRFLPVESVSEIGVDENVLLRLHQRFNSITLDDLRTTAGLVDPASDAVPLFLASVGPGLKRLSIQRYGSINEHDELIARSCPRLTHLDLHGSRLLYGGRLWGSMQYSWLSELQSLNLGATPVGALAVHLLSAYVRSATGAQLRHVVLAQSSIGFEGLSVVAELLRTNTTLEIVELDRTTEGDGARYAQLRQQMRDEFDYRQIGSKSLPVASRLAFVWTVATLRDRIEGLHAMDGPIIALVFEFAAERISRHLLWP